MGYCRLTAPTPPFPFLISFPVTLLTHFILLMSLASSRMSTSGVSFSSLGLLLNITFSVTVLVIQSCPTLWDSMYYSSPGSPVHGILQARILQWIAIPFSRGSSQPRGQTWVSCIAGRFLTVFFFFFHLFLLVGGSLLYNIVVVFVIH